MKPIQSIVFLGVIQVMVHFVLAMELVLTHEPGIYLNRAETRPIVSAIVAYVLSLITLAGFIATHILTYMDIEAIGVFERVVYILILLVVNAAGLIGMLAVANQLF
ncbi:uncharacterized protein [Diabrotica undecimpunctata]|uniref:uncharacterized protein n=1 Tax=Diabrotica undecimpunctata TaxID=50387 RepID=UPI003B63B38C